MNLPIGQMGILGARLLDSDYTRQDMHMSKSGKETTLHSQLLAIVGGLWPSKLKYNILNFLYCV